jgi:hypothetical protein
MFRKPPPPTPRAVPPESHEARLRALGALLDRRGYATEGLCILEVAGEFVVSGLAVHPGQPLHDGPTLTETIGAAELAAALAAL